MIARYWADLEISKAVNGYWSPLLSWLLAPMTWVGIDPLFGYRILVVVMALMLCLAVVWLGRPAAGTLGGRIAIVMLWASVGTFIAGGMAVMTPGTLSGVVFAGVLLAAHRFVTRTTVWRGVVFGGSLALLFFAKSAAFYGAVVMLVVIGVIVWRRAGGLRRGYVAAALTFLVPSVLWIIAISVKYHRLTMSTAASYNWSIAGPTQPPHPVLLVGHLPPVNATDPWAWVDPSWLPMPQWSGFENLSYVIQRGFFLTWSGYSGALTYSPLVLLGLAGLFHPRLGRAGRTVRVALIATIVAVMATYAISLMETRYTLLFVIPLVVLSAMWVRKPMGMSTPLLAVLGVLFATMVIPAFNNIRAAEAVDISFTGAYDVSMRSRSVVPPGSTIAGPEISTLVSTFAYCYWTDTHCLANYTLTGDPGTDATAINDMRAHGIQYYVVLNDQGPRIANLVKVYEERPPDRGCFHVDRGLYLTCTPPTIAVYRVS